jgi:hypothetical protein
MYAGPCRLLDCGVLSSSTVVASPRGTARLMDSRRKKIDQTRHGKDFMASRFRRSSSRGELPRKGVIKVPGAKQLASGGN